MLGSYRNHRYSLIRGENYSSHPSNPFKISSLALFVICWTLLVSVASFLAGRDFVVEPIVGFPGKLGELKVQIFRPGINML
jgi:hypothetical protein